MSAFWFESLQVWAVEIDDLEGIFRGGQWTVFRLDGETAGPFLIQSIALVSKRLKKLGSITLVIQAACNRGLDRFIGGRVETTDPL